MPTTMLFVGVAASHQFSAARAPRFPHWEHADLCPGVKRLESIFVFLFWLESRFRKNIRSGLRCTFTDELVTQM